MAAIPRAANPDSRTVSMRSLRTLLAFLQLTEKPRLMFRDIHGEALRAAEKEFRDVWIAADTRAEMKKPPAKARRE